jgi:UDP-glucose 4-epimerase
MEMLENYLFQSHALNPLSPYGKSKMLAEQNVFRCSKLRKIQNTISLRIFNVYWDGQVRENDVVTRFARRLSKGLPPIIYGNGKHTRDFISVDGDWIHNLRRNYKAFQLYFFKFEDKQKSFSNF